MDPAPPGRRPRIVVVGSSNTDFVVRSARIPRPGETVLGSAFLRAAGGKGANQAVAAARLGADVTFVARVGDDDLGRAAIDDYAAAGIDTRHVRTTPGMASGVALIVVDADGENAIAVAPGANATLCERDVNRAKAEIERADALLLQLETPLSASARAIEMARASATLVLLDPAPAHPNAVELLTGVDVLTPNAAELSALTDDDPASGAGRSVDLERDAREVRAMGASAVVVTLGADGVALARNGEFLRLPSQRVDAVDTTGAGDAFSGALAVALAEGRDLLEAIAFAQRAASWSVRREGAQPSLPHRTDLGVDA